MLSGTTTELAAINRMLHVIGESPAGSMISLPDDGLTARRILEDVTREVLVEGWHFNTDERFPLMAEATAPHGIPIPVTATSIDLSCNTEFDLVPRGGRLYDRRKKTFSFPGRTFYADITWYFPFDELPEALRQYVLIKAARQFAGGDLPSSLIHGLTEQREMEKRVLWETEDARQADYNLLRQNRTINRINDREAG
jgi:hypothetical protein